MKVSVVGLGDIHGPHSSQRMLFSSFGRSQAYKSPRKYVMSNSKHEASRHSRKASA